MAAIEPFENLTRVKITYIFNEAIGYQIEWDKNVLIDLKDF